MTPTKTAPAELTFVLNHATGGEALYENGVLSLETDTFYVGDVVAAAAGRVCVIAQHEIDGDQLMRWPRLLADLEFIE